MEVIHLSFRNFKVVKCLYIVWIDTKGFRKMENGLPVLALLSQYKSQVGMCSRIIGINLKSHGIVVNGLLEFSLSSQNISYPVVGKRIAGFDTDYLEKMIYNSDFVEYQLLYQGVVILIF